MIGRQTGKPSVPPGQGSEKTRERNQRRKLLRQAVRQQSQLSQTQTGSPSPASNTATRSDAPTTLTGTTADAVQLLPIPKSTANRNKNKTYMKGMEGVSGKRTVFEQETQREGKEDGYAADISMSVQEEIATPAKASPHTVVPTSDRNASEQSSVNTLLERVKSLVSTSTPVTPISTRTTAPPTSTQSTSFQDSASKPKRPHSSTRPRFTAPSALDTLPSNMFVTSVYFPWPHGRKQGKNKSSQGVVEVEDRPDRKTFDTSFVHDRHEEVANSIAAIPTTQEGSALSPATNPVSTSSAPVKGLNHRTEREKKRRAYLLGREYIPPADYEGDDGVEEELVDAQMSGVVPRASAEVVAPAEDPESSWLRADTAWEELSVITMENLDELKEGSILAWKVSLFTITIEFHVLHIFHVLSRLSRWISRHSRPRSR